MDNTKLEFFLLSANYLDLGNRFEITLWGAGANGERARIIVDDFRPMFFCAGSVPARETAAACDRKRLPMRSLDGREIDCLYFSTQAALQNTAKRLRAAGFPVFETDVNPLSRYLMERMVAGAMTVAGTAAPMAAEGRFACYRNPRVRGGSVIPKLRVMSVYADALDNGTIRGIACAETNAEKVFASDNERQLLTDAMAHIRAADPDIITGWDVAGQTLRMIRDRCDHCGLRFDIGREQGSNVSSHERQRTWRDGYTSRKIVWTARVPGRVVMDAPTLLAAYHRDPDEYRLDAGAENDCAGSPAAKCLTYAKNILRIFDDAEILPNAVERSRRSGQLLDGTGGSVASFDYLYLPLLHRAGYAAKDVRDIAPPSRSLPGGHVVEPAPGLYENVLVFDFKSLYPSLIMTFLIDPLGYSAAKAAGDNDPRHPVITNPAGTKFSRAASILPGIIRELMDARAQAIDRKNPYLSQAIKILMNSFYGVLGSTGCRFFSEEISSTITMTGQYILKKTIEHIEKFSGKKIIYGDTDSVFVELGHIGGGKDVNEQAAVMGKEISTEVNEWLRAHLSERFGADSALVLKYESHYNKFFIPSVRHGVINQGAKKHYCGAAIGKDGSMELTFKGMEAARSDWTELAKEFQRELFIKFFTGQPLEDHIISVHDSVMRGACDDKLAYKKRIRKSLNEYTVNMPPHVQAAKMLDAPARSVTYYITKAGPQPIEKLTAPLDYRHYIDSQLAPIADSILEWMGKSFDKIVSGQQDLFE